MINNFLEEGDYQPSHRVYTHPRWQHHIYIGDIQSALDLPFIESHNIGTGTPCFTQVACPLSSRHSCHRPRSRPLRPSHPTHRLPPPRQQITKHQHSIRTVLRSSRTGHRTKQHPCPLCGWHLTSRHHYMQSSTLVIAYLMKQHSWGFKQAIAFVRESRPCVLPNLGF